MLQNKFPEKDKVKAVFAELHQGGLASPLEKLNTALFVKDPNFLRKSSEVLTTMTINEKKFEVKRSVVFSLYRSPEEKPCLRVKINIFIDNNLKAHYFFRRVSQWDDSFIYKIAVSVFLVLMIIAVTFKSCGIFFSKCFFLLKNEKCYHERT